MITLRDVQQIIEDNFLENIYFEIIDYINNLSGAELSDFFEYAVDFATCNIIDDAKIINYKEQQFDNQNEIVGSLEVGVEIDGYVHWENEDMNINSVKSKVVVWFSLYEKDDVYEDFAILDIYL